MKDKHRSKGDKDGEHQLSVLLNHAMLTFPTKFLTDFPLMVQSLDTGESVNIDSISDPSFRAILNQIMRCLPLEHSYEFGFYRKENTKPIGGNILKQLLDAGGIKQPTELSSSERLASMHVPMVVMNLLSSFPALKNDLLGLLTNVKEGNAVQLENVENDDIRERLERLFKSLELVYSSRSGCYELPEGKRGDLVEDAIDHVLEVFKCDAAYEKTLSKHSGSKHADDKKKHKKDKKEDKKRSHKSGHQSDSSDSLRGDDSSSNDSDNDEDGNKRRNDSESEDSSLNNEIVIAGVAASLKSSDSLSEREENDEVGNRAIGPAVGPRVGPSMPSAAELDAAKRAYEQYLAQGGVADEEEEQQREANSDEEDDDFGPQVYDPEKERAKSSRPVNSHIVKMQQVPLGYLETALETIEAQQSNVYQQRYGEYVELDGDEAAKKAAAATVREEWILDPGSNKLISEMNGAGTTNRKFQSGKAAIKIAQQVSAAKALVDAGPESAEAKAIMEQYRLSRGPSLYEQHLDKNPSANTTSSSSSGTGLKRKAFDRETDMGGSSKLDKVQVKKLVDNARELDSRFDKGSVQKSFL